MKSILKFFFSKWPSSAEEVFTPVGGEKKVFLTKKPPESSSDFVHNMHNLLLSCKSVKVAASEVACRSV